jgi:hypothetical protein
LSSIPTKGVRVIARVKSVSGTVTTFSVRVPFWGLTALIQRSRKSLSSLSPAQLTVRSWPETARFARPLKKERGKPLAVPMLRISLAWATACWTSVSELGRAMFSGKGQFVVLPNMRQRTGLTVWYTVMRSVCAIPGVRPQASKRRGRSLAFTFHLLY